MAQTLTQEQTQEQKILQQQRITQQHLLGVRLLGMPLAELEQSVNAELDENPALERAADDETLDSIDETGDFDEENAAAKEEREERQDELDKALEHMESDDEPGDYYASSAAVPDDVFGQAKSFRDDLNEQAGELVLSERERSIMDYLLGSLDSDGFLRKETAVLIEELAIYEYIETTADEVERLISLLQSFDPPGIGARSLQECLRIQIERKDDSRLKTCMLRVVNDYFADFTHLRWDKIQEALQLNDVQTDTLKSEFRRLNPKPGAALGETMGRSTQQITPDFIVWPTTGGRLTFEVNTGRLPSLAVSDSFLAMLENYKKTPAKEQGKREQEAMVYVKRKVEQASWFIDAVKQRQRTMEATMSAILAWQRKFFLTGEESDLRPMILKDIAAQTGYDVSTISRVCNEKYARTQWGTFPLRHFFTDNFSSDEGEELSSRKVKMALKELIDGEDKAHPLSDEALVDEMRKRGYNIARRTVAKYRDKMGIPVSKMRTER
ncbi:MAG: RNA polymerase factor sigma-54 [Prevotella sp.]|nr:RNA polymerase factor sigma-54 [Prevotella sp.]